MACRCFTSASRKVSPINMDRIWVVTVFLTLILANQFTTFLAGPNTKAFLSQTLPEAVRFEPLSGDLYAAYEKRHAGEFPMAYLAVAAANGYGGPMKVVVAVDPQGYLIAYSVIAHNETASYFNKLAGSELFSFFLEKSVSDKFIAGHGLDAVSGATVSTNAFVTAVNTANRAIAEKILGLELPGDPVRRVKFGVVEIFLLLYVAIGFIGNLKSVKFPHSVRWVILISSVVIIGFVYNRPLTLAKVNLLILGEWPQWRMNLYWYILMGGILLGLTINNKNPYCPWFCPFGAVQECLGKIGVQTPILTKGHLTFLKWNRRALFWVAILLASVFHNPSLSSYEIFGALFDFLGSPYQHITLVIVIISSLFLYRPWCRFLCPIRSVEEVLKISKKWISRC